MKAIKFLILSLLFIFVGAINVFAGTYSYTVTYVGRTAAQGAGYTITQSSLPNGSITSSADATTLVTNRSGGGGGNSYPTILTTSNITTFIAAREVTGYNSSIAVSTSGSGNSFTGTITITYTKENYTYRVLYEKELLSGTGYTVNSPYDTDGTITIEEDGLKLISKVEITGSNASTYITGNPIDGYDVGYYVSTGEAQLGYDDGYLYVNYVYSGTAETWTDGIFDYSDVCTRATGATIKLPEGECAISLHMEEQEVTDEVIYTVIRATTSGINVWYYDHLTGSVSYDSSTQQSTEITYPINDNGTRLNGETTIDGNETYEFIEVVKFDDADDGFYPWSLSSSAWSRKYYRYKRTHTIPASTVTNVTIPATDGNGNKVVAIQKWGFVYEAHDIINYEYCNVGTDGEITDNKIVGYFDDNHSNWYLKTVSFESPSNLKSVGDYAFMSCKALTDISFPNTIEYMGQGIFEQCTKLKNVNFQDNIAKWTVLKNFTFWMCTAMEELTLPEGITEIEGQQSGAALQYMTSLNNIQLPNTLKKIGPHFLCACSSLKTLTIPAGVEYIDGASFHGAESLEKVILLGPAAALQKEYTGGGGTGSTNDTFSSNKTFCANHLTECKFYVLPEYLESYISDDVWSLIIDNTNTQGLLIDENGDIIYDEDGNPFTVSGDGNGWGNALYPIQEVTRTLPATWVTAIFPYGVTDYKTTFGENTMVAVLDTESDVTKDKATDTNGKTIYVYGIKFKLIESDDIPAATPVMIKVETENDYEFYNTLNIPEEELSNFYNEMTKTHDVSVTSSDGVVITMKGQYVDHPLYMWDFYFLYKNKTTDENGNVTYPDEPAKFYRVPDQSGNWNIKACRCYWTINADGFKTNGEVSSKDGFFDEDPTGIDKVETVVKVEGIYDLQGRKLNVSEDELPKGIFIVNGKKTAVK